MNYTKLFQAILIASTVSVTGCIDMNSSSPGGAPGQDPAPAPQPEPDPTPEPEPQPSDPEPEATTLSLGSPSGSAFDFDWTEVASADFYRLYEQPNASSGFTQVSGDIPAGTTTATLDVPVYDRAQAAYYAEACNDTGCSEQSNIVYMSGNLEDHIDYIKSSNPTVGLLFGQDIELSDDGNTLAIASPSDDSLTTGVNSTPANGATTTDAGAVHVYVKQDGSWVEDAYIKPDILDADDEFGYSVALSGDGTVMAVGMPRETSRNPSDPLENTVYDVGAVIIFKKDGSGNWAQTSYIKPPYDSYAAMYIGSAVALSQDGTILAIGNPGDRSSIGGVDGDPNDGGAGFSGAVWVYKEDSATGNWNPEAHLKAETPGSSSDRFGYELDMSENGDVIAVGSPRDGSCATIINGDSTDNSCADTGSVTIFYKDAGTWNLGDYIKAPNAEADDEFGTSVSLSADGTVLAVGAPGEKGAIGGINTDMSDNNGYNSGAIYIFKSTNNSWTFSDYLKSENPQAGSYFGNDIELSGDGNTLVVGSYMEDSASRGIGGDPFDTSSANAGAAFVFRNDGSSWLQLSYLKPSNTSTADQFGNAVEISKDGAQIFVQAKGEDGDDVGVNSRSGLYYDAPTQSGNPGAASGAVYGF